jgi:tRNA-splicing ligase RtcB
MPDFHQGYGFPIGAVAAFDMEKGVISPEGVGYDINCGIRALVTDIDEKEFSKNRKNFVKELNSKIKIGKNPVAEEISEIDKILKFGAKRAIEKGFGKKEDLEFCEENGKMDFANPKDVSERAKERRNLRVGKSFYRIWKSGRNF